jgi:hypothetical protein
VPVVDFDLQSRKGLDDVVHSSSAEYIVGASQHSCCYTQRSRRTDCSNDSIRHRNAKILFIVLLQLLYCFCPFIVRLAPIAKHQGKQIFKIDRVLIVEFVVDIIFETDELRVQCKIIFPYLLRPLSNVGVSCGSVASEEEVEVSGAVDAVKSLA